MSYSERFKLTVPDTLADIAAKVGKALDPDTGGEASFANNGDGTISVDSPCEPEFKAQAEFLMADANALHQALLDKYAERWADLVPPTLEECQAFIAGIIPEPTVEPLVE